MDQRRSDPYAEIRNWILAMRLAGGIQTNSELMQSYRSVTELCQRLSLVKESDTTVVFLHIGTRHLWSYMVAMANAERGDIEDLKLGAKEMQAAFGRLAERRSSKLVSKDLKQASQMDWHAFTTAMMTMGLLH